MSPRRQSGAAMLTALLIASLVAGLAAAMVWRQYRAIQVEAAERARSQANWVLQGALDWARLILREDARANQTTPVDHLGEVWAVPLAEARLSTFLAAGQESGGGGTADVDAGPDAFLSGSIADAQGLYNLRNLLGGAAVPAIEQDTLQRICQSAGAPPDTVAQIVNGMRAAFATPLDEASAPLQPNSVDELAWFGLSADTIERLRPFVVILPVPTRVNLNTAPREVIAALLSIDLASAERLAQGRRSAPLQTVEAAGAYLPQGSVQNPDRAAVQSSYFFVTGRLRMDGRVQEQRSLVYRNGLNMVTLQRQPVAPSAATPG